MAENKNKADIKPSKEKEKILDEKSLEKDKKIDKDNISNKVEESNGVDNSSSFNTSNNSEADKIKNKDSEKSQNIVDDKNKKMQSEEKFVEEKMGDKKANISSENSAEEAITKKSIKGDKPSSNKLKTNNKKKTTADNKKDDAINDKVADNKNDDAIDDKMADNKKDDAIKDKVTDNKNLKDQEKSEKDNETKDETKDNEPVENKLEDDGNNEEIISTDNTEETEKDIVAEENITNDITTTSDTAEPKLKKKSENGKKFKELVSRNKLPIIVVAALLIIAIGVSVAVAIVNRNLVRISSAEDFLEKSVEGKTTYVIKKDIDVEGDLEIPNGMNIDMNGNTLTVTGAMKYSADAEDKDIFIGDKKGAVILKGGKLIVESLEINSPDASLTIYSDFQGNMNVNLKSLTLENTLTSKDEGSVVINANNFTNKRELNIMGNSSTLDITSGNAVIDAGIIGEKTNLTITSTALTINSEITAKNINFVNCGTEDNKALINNKINGNVSFANSFAKISEESELGDIIADENTDLDIYGKISTLDGGLLVVFRDSSSASLASNIQELRIYQEANITSIIEAGELVLYEVLSKPLDITINQDDSSLMCYVSKVNNADEYVLYIDDTEIEDTFTSNKIDITSYITQPKTYTIGVKAVSNQERLLDSSIASVEYTYNITLNKPLISVDSSEGYKINFASVPFAHEYKYSINNGEYMSYKGPFEAGELVNIDINSKIIAAGEYTVKVIAYGQNEDAFEPSEVAQTSFVKKIKLSAVSYDNGNISIERQENNLNSAWDSVTYAKYYSIYINDVLYSKTKTTSIQWTLGDLENNDKITIIADGYNFYTESDPVNIIYQYESLDPITISTSISNNMITISWDAVNNATSYKIYLDDSVIDEVTTTDYSIAHTPANSGTYKVQAVADFFNPSISNAVIVDNPTLVAPVLTSAIESEEIVLNWTEVANAETYMVYLNDTAVTGNIDSTTYTIAYTPQNSGEYYVVALASGYNNSPNSNIVNIEQPTLGATTLDYVIDTSLDFTWTEVINATSYELYRESEEEDELIANTTNLSISITPASGNYYILAKADGYIDSKSNVVIVSDTI